MWSKRVVGMYLVLLAILLGCFFMPDFVAGIIDRNTLGNTVVLDAKSISFEARPNLTMPERLTLIAGSDHESIILKNGKLSESEARGRIADELGRFLGSSGLIGNASGLTVDECTPVFVIDAEDPAINMIVWEARLSSVSGEEMLVKLDEETGTLLHIILYRYTWQNAVLASNDAVDDPFRNDAELLCGLIEEYYGAEAPAELTYALIDGLGFYNVGIEFDGVPVALYGIVRDSRITVNE